MMLGIRSPEKCFWRLHVEYLCSIAERVASESMIMTMKMLWTYYLLSYHSTHAYANDVQFTLAGPADVVEHFYQVLSHGRGGVSRRGLVGVANAPIVSHQRRVLIAFVVGEVFRLALPCVLHATKAHDPLHGVSR